jgi:hypothetical protein
MIYAKRLLKDLCKITRRFSILLELLPMGIEQPLETFARGYQTITLLKISEDQIKKGIKIQETTH